LTSRKDEVLAHTLLTDYPLASLADTEAVSRLAVVMTLLAAVATLGAQGSELTFHHLHLNGTGMQEFYARLFDPSLTSQSPVAGYPALRSGSMLLLFGEPHASTERTPVAPPGETAVWHFGWGTVSLGETYLQHAAREVQWEPPLPAGQLHVHLLSRSPADAAAWYRDRLGARVEVLASARDPSRAAETRPEQRIAEAVVYFGDFALLIYRTNETLVSTRGKRVDHFALTVAGARFGETPATMIEGPDKIAIEVIR
jgi:hypothetical protein